MHGWHAGMIGVATNFWHIPILGQVGMTDIHAWRAHTYMAGVSTSFVAHPVRGHANRLTFVIAWMVGSANNFWCNLVVK